ncbi:cobalamin ABC transporter substrate-binding protein [Cellvibrio zantedeschiae]|uniref:Cobalamin ABC transporter substrate-binding protein n=1 Tax=Cellvibrio zantedeschiae TaxID=1237077 RepID=A0ABQ3B1W0_9GAMM|nr:ABC transporter substrate-binding protein [Cellvibrio zantedeschiae]GGY74615.1 cobalamin ABC transporter substrate-binding protein [Cellvibrio zantedeschiae]
MRNIRFVLAFALTFFSFIQATCAEEVVTAQRIVSINLCLDALLIKLVEPARVDSLYYLSANPQFSSVAEQAKKYNLNRGLAEDIVPRNPDLVLAGTFTSSDLRALLKQLNFRVELLDLPRNLDDISTHIRRFGDLVSRPAEAEVMAQELEQKLAQLDEARKTIKPVPGFWYSSNGVVIGSDTVENELMTRAGFHNLALDKNIVGFRQLDLEELILAQPKVIILEASDVQAFSLAQEYVEHPALRSNHVKIIRLPSTLSCVAPVAADAIESLMQQRKSLPY